MDDAPRISITVLNWNNYKDTKKCLKSLQEITYPNYEVIVVDNGSEDGSTQRIQKEFPKYIYIYNHKNLGFTAGINVGLRYAFEKGADYMFYLNNDMIVDKDFLWPLIEEMKDKKVGIAAPAIYCYPQTDKLHTAGLKTNFWKGRGEELYLTERREVEGLDSCFLIKRELIDKIGYFDEDYFLYFEDIDYCLRARKAGFKVICQPKSKIWHKIGTTVNKNIPRTTFYSYQGKFIFVKKNAPFYIRYLFYVYGSLYLFLKFIKSLAKRDKSMALALRDVLIDFWFCNSKRSYKTHR